jgi:Peptidase family M28
MVRFDVSCLLPMVVLVQGAGTTTVEAGVGGASLKPTARQLKPTFVGNMKRALEQTNASMMSALAEDAYGHLLELCMDANGDPNPRVTCTEGYKLAWTYVEDQMIAMGLVPLGNVERTSYVQMVDGSVNETFCPPGMANVIGMVQGTTKPDEFVVYTADLDGPNNGNPQTVMTRGNTGVSNAYDDALAVAVGLAMAKQFLANPPDRSVVILITDGEEGWDHVGELPLGTSSNRDQFVDSDWFTALSKDLGTVGRLGAAYW